MDLESGAPAQWPAGWYPIGPTASGWWDGTAWSGHVQHTTPHRSEEEAGAFSAAFAWWGSLLIGLWPALIIFLTNGPNSAGANRFARFSAGEALNVHLTLLCLSLPVYGVAFAAFFGAFLSTSVNDQAGGLIVGGFIVVWGVLVLASIGLAIVYVLAAVRAHNGVWWRATYAIPFLREHRSLAPRP